MYSAEAAPPNHWGALYFSESRQLHRAGATYAGPPPPPAAGGGAPLRKSKGSTKFLGWRELLVPFEKLGAEKRLPSRVRWLFQDRELRAVEDLVP